MNCSQVAMFQIMPALCLHGQGEGEGAGGGGVVNQMWTGLDRGRGVPKILKFAQTSFMDDSFHKLVMYAKSAKKSLRKAVDLIVFSYN